MQSLRPCQMIWCENRIHFSRGMIRIKILLDFLRIVLRREFQPPRDAVHMRVDHDSVGYFEPCPQHDVRGLARDAGKGEQFLHVFRNLPSELGDNFLRRAHHGFGFIAEESGGAHVRLELFRRERGKCLDRRIFAEQLRRDPVHVHVGRLRGEDGRDHQFPRAGVRERAGDVGIELVEPLQNLGDAFRRDGIVGL